MWSDVLTEVLVKIQICWNSKRSGRFSLVWERINAGDGSGSGCGVGGGGGGEIGRAHV